MDEQRLWAPWRLGYIKGQEDAEAPPEPDAWPTDADRGCFLCRCASDFSNQPDADHKNMVVRRGELSLVVLNRYPYSNGHLLVSPRRHVGDLGDLTEEEHLALMHSLTTMQRALTEKLNAHGFNIGLNLGQVAGAGVPGHLHWHIVPRWPGDHNFISVLGATRVIPQALEELWQALREAK